jgi:tRNA threonylcarbamoyladenosine biosynthesis protein TsaE
MKKEFISNNVKETKKIAYRVVDDFLEGRNVVLLEGELGAGKTAFSQFILERLGAEGPFTSPTFVIMKEYKLRLKVKSKKLKVGNNSKFKIQNSKFHVVFHIDCYRIEKEREMIDLGWEEIISDKSNLILAEWPERIDGILPKKYVKIKFEIEDENKRKIIVYKN